MRPKDITYGLTAERARHLLAYDPVDGVLRWKPVEDLHDKVKPGMIAGSDNGNGYIRIWIDGHRYVLHRVIWLIVYGEWPKNMVDHRDGDKTNNRLENFREATNSQNKANGSYRTSPLGLKGITASGKKWHAQIRKDGKTHYLGTFEDPEDAHAAYMAAAQHFHGEFANSGKVH